MEIERLHPTAVLLSSLPLILVLSTVTINLSSALPEARGTVNEVLDGDSIVVQGLGEVRFADIDCPEMNTSEGLDAKAYTKKWILGKIVYLDVDDKRGKDKYGRYVCTVYLSKPDGSLDAEMNFNRMLLESGHACLWDFHNDEFNPLDWWGGYIPEQVCLHESRFSQASSNLTSSQTPSLEESLPETSSSFPLPLEDSEEGVTSSDKAFVGSSKSNKYHYPKCEWASRISPKNQVWFSGPKDAEDRSYLPCGLCTPP